MVLWTWAPRDPNRWPLPEAYSPPKWPHLCSPEAAIRHFVWVCAQLCIYLYMQNVFLLPKPCVCMYICEHACVCLCSLWFLPTRRQYKNGLGLHSDDFVPRMRRCTTARRTRPPWPEPPIWTKNSVRWEMAPPTFGFQKKLKGLGSSLLRSRYHIKSLLFAWIHV